MLLVLVVGKLLVLLLLDKLMLGLLLALLALSRELPKAIERMFGFIRFRPPLCFL